MRYHKKSFFNRLLMMMICLALIPAILVGAAYDGLNRNMLVRQAQEELGTVGQQTAELMAGMLEEYREMLADMSTSLAVRLYLSDGKEAKAEAAALLQRHMFSRKDQIDIHIIPYHTLSDSISSGAVPNIYRYRVYKNWGIFARLKEAGEGQIIHINQYKSHVGATVSLTLGKNVYYAGKAVGCVLVDVYRNNLMSIITRTATKSNRQMTIFYKGGQVILDSKSTVQEGLSSTQAQRELLSRWVGKTGVSPFWVKEESVYGFFPIPGTELNILLEANLHMAFSSYNRMRMVLFASLAILCAICAIVAFRITRSIHVPVRKMKEAFEAVERGELTTRVALGDLAELQTIESSFNHLTKRLSDLLDEKVEEAQLLRQAQLNALQAQMNPHFLYNTLATIRSLARIHGEKEIQTIAENLNTLLRSSISTEKELATLEEDIALIHQYLAIQNIRFNQKFEFVCDVSHELKRVTLPKLLLQTIVENAIIHGLEGKVGPGTITLSAHREEGGTVVLCVADDGLGMPPGIMERINRGELEQLKNHIGLSNAIRRIRLQYGPNCGLWVESELNQYTRVFIRVQER